MSLKRQQSCSFEHRIVVNLAYFERDLPTYLTVMMQKQSMHGHNLWSWYIKHKLYPYLINKGKWKIQSIIYICYHGLSQSLKNKQIYQSKSYRLSPCFVVMFHPLVCTVAACKAFWGIPSNITRFQVFIILTKISKDNT